MDTKAFLSSVLQNPAHSAILDALRAMQLPDAWLVSGSLAQTVWNDLTERPLAYGINDYDVLYFDPDPSWEAEDRVIKEFDAIGRAHGIPIQARNQARVHLWYPEKFGRPYPPLSCATESIDRFITRNTKVGIQRCHSGDIVYAPDGFDDIANLLITPNPTPNFSLARYHEKAARWKALWPELTIVEAQ